MASVRRPGRASIFSPATAREREENFESYWLYQQRRDGEILEDNRDLTEKKNKRARPRRAPPAGPGAVSSQLRHDARRSAEPRSPDPAADLSLQVRASRMDRHLAGLGWGPVGRP